MTYKYDGSFMAINEDQPQNNNLKRRKSEMDLGRRSFEKMRPKFGAKRDVHVSQQSIDFEEMEILRAENSKLQNQLRKAKRRKPAVNQNQTVLMLQKDNEELRKQVKRNESAKDVEAALFEMKIEQNEKITAENKLLKQELLALQQNAVRGGKNANEDIQKVKQSYEDKLWDMDNHFRRDYSRLEERCKSLEQQLKNTQPLMFREREDLVAKIRSLKQKNSICESELSKSIADRRVLSKKRQQSKQTLDKYVRKMSQYGQKVKMEFSRREQQIADLHEKNKDLIEEKKMLEEKITLFSSSPIVDTMELLLKKLEEENVRLLGENRVLKAENQDLVGNSKTFPKNANVNDDIFTMKNRITSQDDMIEILQNTIHTQNREQKLHESFMEKQIGLLKNI